MKIIARQFSQSDPNISSLNLFLSTNVFKDQEMWDCNYVRPTFYHITMNGFA